MDLGRFAPWPLLVGAIAAFSFVVGLTHDDARQATAEALVVVGSVLIGAWIALLASHGHTGSSTDIDKEN